MKENNLEYLQMPFKKRKPWQLHRFTESLGSSTNCPQSRLALTETNNKRTRSYETRSSTEWTWPTSQIIFMNFSGTKQLIQKVFLIFKKYILRSFLHYAKLLA